MMKQQFHIHHNRLFCGGISGFTASLPPHARKHEQLSIATRARDARKVTQAAENFLEVVTERRWNTNHFLVISLTLSDWSLLTVLSTHHAMPGAVTRVVKFFDFFRFTTGVLYFQFCLNRNTIKSKFVAFEPLLKKIWGVD